MTSDGAATTVCLVRHAAHDRLGRVLCGRMPDVTLGARGRAEAEALARHFSGVPVAAVLSSPLARTRETAAPIAAAVGAPVRTSEGLNEIDFGDWTGRRFDELASDPRWHDWNRARADGCPPGGEPMRAAQRRALAAVDGLRETVRDGVVVAISHADIIKAIVCGVLGLSLDRHDAFEIEPASVTTLVLWQGGGKLVSLNDTAPVRAAFAERTQAAA